MPTLYQRRIEDGLCGMCGKDRGEEKSLCECCKQKCKQRAEAKRAKAKQSNLCLDCNTPLKSGTRCETCKAAQKESRKRTISAKKDAGVCVACPRPAKPGCTLCQGCIDARSEVSSKHYHRRKQSGTCRFCSDDPLPNKVLCQYHTEKYADYRLQTKLAVFEAYGGPYCALCDNDDLETLEMDHINGGGNQHRKSLGMEGGGYQFYLWLRRENYPEGYRVLCPTCNKKAHLGLLKTQ